MEENMGGIVIGALAGAGVSTYMDWPFWPCLAVGAIIFWMLAHGTGIGGVGGGLFTAIGNFFRWVFGTVGGIIAGTSLFLVLLLALVNATGVSLRKVVEYFMVLGAPWNWPGEVKLPVLMFLFGLMITMGITLLAVRGQWRWAGVILVVGFLGIFTAWLAPPLWEAIRPKPKNPMLVRVPLLPDSWDDAVQAAAESGVGPIGFCVGYEWIAGPRWPCAGEKTLAELVRGAIDSVLPDRSPAPAASSVTPPVLYPFEADGCHERDLGWNPRWSPDKGSMRVYDPAGGSHVETLGTKSPILAFGPGHWRFCAEPDATGVMIWE